MTYRAVVVDDEPFMLEGMRLMIDWGRCGFELCGEAGNAREALRLLDTAGAHLLLTDIRMPGMLGTELAAIACRRHPGLVVLFFSGFRDFGYAQTAIRTHAIGYLTKPIDPEEVHEALLRVKAELDRRAGAAAADGQPGILDDPALRRIALGDGSPENLARAAALMRLGKEDACRCAVLAPGPEEPPASALRYAEGCGAVLFLLPSRQYGLCFRGDGGSLAPLARLAGEANGADLGVGGVYRGAAGFGKSLLEALEALGACFEPSGPLRIYHPMDGEAASWLARARPSALRDAVLDRHPARLARELGKLRQSADEARPSLFALRCLASALDPLLADGGRLGDGPPLERLWRGAGLAADAWLDAFCRELEAIQAGAAAETGYPAPVRAVLDIIRTRYAEPLSLAGVADELCLNAAYLGQLVRRCTGETFHERLLAARAGRACVLLRQTVKPIGEVALEAGFRDADYFSRQFRGLTGMSPSAYRNARAVQGGDGLAPRQ